MATVSSATSFFPTAQEGFTTTTSGSTASGATSVALASVAGYTNGDVVTLVIEPTSTSAKQVFTGVVDTGGLQITNVIWTEGTNQTHAGGVTVVDYETATAWALQAKGLKVQHNQDGTHAAVTATSLTTGTLTVTSGSTLPAGDIVTANLATSAVTTPKLKPSVIDFTASTGSNFTTTSATFVDVTGVTTTYQVGATNETLFLWLGAMINVGTSANAVCTLSVAGVDLTPGLFVNTSTIFQQSKQFVVNVSANALVTIKMRAKTDASTLNVSMGTTDFVPRISGFAVSNV